jgi:hypothetical protein
MLGLGAGWQSQNFGCLVAAYINNKLWTGTDPGHPLMLKQYSHAIFINCPQYLDSWLSLYFNQALGVLII